MCVMCVYVCVVCPYTELLVPEGACCVSLWGESSFCSVLPLPPMPFLPPQPHPSLLGSCCPTYPVLWGRLLPRAQSKQQVGGATHQPLRVPPQAS